MRRSKAVLQGLQKVDWTDQIAITSGIHPEEDALEEMFRYNKGSDALYRLITILTDRGGRIPRQIGFLGNVILHTIRFLRTLWAIRLGIQHPRDPGHANKRKLSTINLQATLVTFRWIQPEL